MTNTSRVIAIGVLFGLIGAAGQFWLVWLDSSQTSPLRGLLTFSLGILIGTLAGFTGKRDALKAAGLAGFVAGVMVSSVGISLVIRNPNIIGTHPFATAQSALSFISSLLAGTVVSSWIVAGIAVLVALPISQTQTLTNKLSTYKRT